MDLTAILKKLVTFQTVTHDLSENRKALEWVKDTVRGLPLRMIDHTSLGHHSLVITTQKTNSPKLWMSAHMDVVPGRREQYSAKIRDGKMYGRGVYDMKFAIACYIQLLSELAPKLNDFDFGIMITTDEEIGGHNGAGYLLENGYNGIQCISPDAGADWCIEGSAKGILHLRIESRGISAHAARPWLGKNAIDSLMHFLVELNSKFTKGNANPNEFENTCSIGVIHTDSEHSVINEVPDYAYAEVDIRTIDLNSRAVVGKQLKALSSQFPDITITIIEDDPCFEQDTRDTNLDEFAKLIKKYKGEFNGYCKSDGSSDARFFASKGMSVISTRPKGNGHHSSREWIDLEDLNVFYKVLKEYVLSQAKI
jgi:succinyl-diaminopimelate desuccinylase